MSSKSPSTIVALLKIIQMLMEQRFWGQIIINFKDGEPIIINRNEQIKLEK